MEGQQTVRVEVVLHGTTPTPREPARTGPRLTWTNTVRWQMVYRNLDSVPYKDIQTIGHRRVGAIILFHIEGPVLFVEQTLQQDGVEWVRHGHLLSS